MAISAATTTPLKFLRRVSGNMEPAMITLPVNDTSTAYRFGHPLMVDATNGKVKLATGAAGTGMVISAINATVGLVGIVGGFAAEAFVAPTAAGAHAGGIAFTSAASLTAADPIPSSEKVAVILATDDSIFAGHETNGATDITAPTRIFAEATGGILQRVGLWIGTPTGETARGMIDCSVAAADANQIVLPLEWRYPQPIPQARGASAGPDPFRVVLGSGGTSNPAVEFKFVGTLWNPTA